MGTRGFIGIRNNRELVTGYYHHFDSYYDGLGKTILDIYFDNTDKTKIINALKEEGDEEKDDFIYNGSFCEYAYVYNMDNDTLEIYRGGFNSPQTFDNKKRILQNLKEIKEKYYCHLIMIIDRKQHTKQQVLQAFNLYDNNEDDENNPYPERKIIPLKLPKNYTLIVEQDED